MYNTLKSLLESRRTPRYVDREDIPQEDIQKILDAANLAPSFDKVYPYEIFVLTNSPAGIDKKEELVERYLCRNINGTISKVGDPWNDREIVQPILSGLSLVYVSIPKASATSSAGPLELALISQRDAMISATYAMLAGQSLGYRAGMFSAVTFPDETANILFSNNAMARIVTTVTIANRDLLIIDPTDNRQYIDYKNQQPFVYHSKHKNKTALHKVTVL
jgi:nitroreductase